MAAHLPTHLPDAATAAKMAWERVAHAGWKVATADEPQAVPAEVRAFLEATAPGKPSADLKAYLKGVYDRLSPDEVLVLSRDAALLNRSPVLRGCGFAPHRTAQLTGDEQRQTLEAAEQFYRLMKLLERLSDDELARFDRVRQAMLDAVRKEYDPPVDR